MLLLRSLAPAIMLGLVALVPVVSAANSPAVVALATPTPLAVPPPSPQRTLGLIRSTFRLHRPPPPYVTYTFARSQKTDRGFPDYVNTYTYHVWCRTSDRAALARKVFIFPAMGPLEFQRPAFNEERDPGPPTADLFEPAPAHPHPIDFVPTPEASALPVIGSVSLQTENDYRVTEMTTEGGLLHLRLQPIREPMRNRLRELWADKKTYELRKLVATDRLFVQGPGGGIYATIFTVTMGMLDGFPIVTSIHGEVGDNYQGDGKQVDMVFRDVAFPQSLPSWYFDAKQYAMHTKDAPT